MSETVKDPVISKCCQASNRLTNLKNLCEGLEKCQKSLNDYLNSKRNAFPRFFFISDDELLSILGSSDPEAVQEHMIKVISLFIVSCLPAEFLSVQARYLPVISVNTGYLEILNEFERDVEECDRL